jgi:hypothetical protein
MWWSKYRAAILERNPEVQLLRIVEAYEAMQRCLDKVEKNSSERRKLDNAIKTLDSLRRSNSAPGFSPRAETVSAIVWPKRS